MILYQLNKKQDVIGIVSSDVISATLEEQINTAGSLKFVVAKKLSAGCQYVLIQRQCRYVHVLQDSDGNAGGQPS